MHSTVFLHQQVLNLFLFSYCNTCGIYSIYYSLQFIIKKTCIYQEKYTKQIYTKK